MILWKSAKFVRNKNRFARQTLAASNMKIEKLIIIVFVTWVKDLKILYKHNKATNCMLGLYPATIFRNDSSMKTQLNKIYHFH